MNLVFASGFLVPQHVPIVDYFNGLRARLQGRHETLFPDVGPLETCEARANELAHQIAHRFPTGEIHIIAHSMGGLDSPLPDRAQPPWTFRAWTHRVADHIIDPAFRKPGCGSADG